MAELEVDQSHLPRVQEGNPTLLHLLPRLYSNKTVNTHTIEHAKCDTLHALVCEHVLICRPLRWKSKVRVRHSGARKKTMHCCSYTKE